MTTISPFPPKTERLQSAIAWLILLCVTCLLASRSAWADVFNMPSGNTNLSFVKVGGPNNAADPLTGYGAVTHTYSMAKYDVTVGQYCQFLNAVAAISDPNGLYDSHMALGNFYGFSTVGVAQNGSVGNYNYTVTGSYSQGVNVPIFDITWANAARFCNWLQNGQPTGAQGPGTTETGAYTLNADLMMVTRNENATYFIPSENEWYKAAYFDPTLNGGGGGYWKYPTKSNTAPGNTLPDTGNNANYYITGYSDPTNLLTPVGSFVLSPGPYGTYDMGGNVLQWNEAAITSTSRGLRGGAYDTPAFTVNHPDSFNLSSANRGYYNFPTSVNPDVGFRIASVSLAGDYNGNGVVDAGDYLVWRKGVGNVVPPWSGGDDNGNGFVENAEYQPWRQNYGRTAGGGSGTSISAAVPEPTSTAFLLAAGLIMMLQRDARCKRHL